MQLSECRSRKLVARSVHKLATKTPITDLVFSPDGRNLAAASSARVWLFEVASGKVTPAARYLYITATHPPLTPRSLNSFYSCVPPLSVMLAPFSSPWTANT